jgi:alpha-galactosidase
MTHLSDEKIVLIGAGSAMFTRGVVSDLIRSQVKADLALVDTDPQALEAALRLVEKMVAARRAPIKVQAAVDRRAVLPGATAVISTIGVGGRRAWEQDVFIPRKYGLCYPVGDTVGPGGTSRALRMIPPMIAIARDILELCPRALFFNYANPMAPICRAVRKETGADMIGLCIGTHDTWHYLANELGVAPQDLAFSAAGINHLTWFTRFQIQGQDALPQMQAAARRHLEHAEQIRTGKEESAGGAFSSSLGFPFAWQCLLWFGAFPSPEDRHVTEFFPQLFRTGRYYGRTLGVDEFTFEGTIASGDMIYEAMRADAFHPDPLDESYFDQLGGEQEQVVEILLSIRANRMKRVFANLPNSGQAPGLPAHAIVETPALTDGLGLHAVVQAPLSPALVGTLATRFQWVETVVAAALEGSREKFVEALILDGGAENPDQAVALANDLLAAQAAYLPAFR